MKDRTITIRLSFEQYETILKSAKEKGVDISEIIRRLIDLIENDPKIIKEDMEYHKKLYEEKKEKWEKIEIKIKTKQPKKTEEDLVEKAKNFLKKRNNY